MPARSYFHNKLYAVLPRVHKVHKYPDAISLFKAHTAFIEMGRGLNPVRKVTFCCTNIGTNARDASPEKWLASKSQHRLGLYWAILWLHRILTRILNFIPKSPSHEPIINPPACSLCRIPGWKGKGRIHGDSLWIQWSGSGGYIFLFKHDPEVWILALPECIFVKWISFMSQTGYYKRSISPGENSCSPLYRVSDVVTTPFDTSDGTAY